MWGFLSRRLGFFFKSGDFLKFGDFYPRDFRQNPGIGGFLSPGFLRIGFFGMGIFLVGWDIPPKSHLWSRTRYFIIWQRLVGNTCLPISAHSKLFLVKKVGHKLFWPLEPRISFTGNKRLRAKSKTSTRFMNSRSFGLV